MPTRKQQPRRQSELAGRHPARPDTTPATTDAPAPAAAPQTIQTVQEPATPARKGRGGRKAPEAENATQPTAQDDKPRTEPPKMLFPPREQVEGRVSLKLHADDLRAMGEAKLDDRVDHNQRIRAMIAIWRANPRFRTQVDRLARVSPKS